MKKILLFSAFIFLLNHTWSQVKLVEVDPANQSFTVKNFSESVVNLKSYRLATSTKNYDDLMSFTVEEGSLEIPASGGIVKLSIKEFIVSEGGQIALFLPFEGGDNELSDPNFLVDFVQWGSGGYQSEDVADTKGIWEAGTFISGIAPYSFIGGKSDYGVAFWQGYEVTLDINLRIISVDPTVNRVTIKNFGTDSVDISDYRLCSKIEYTNNLTSQTTVVGDLNLQGNDTVIIELSGFGGTLSEMDSIGADLALYKDNNFTDTASMVDFVQWKSAGNGRESVADSKGIWSIGDFLNFDAPYRYIGNGNQSGLSFWTGIPIDSSGGSTYSDFNHTQNDYSDISVFPNPGMEGQDIVVNMEKSAMPIYSLEVIDILGVKHHSLIFSKSAGKARISDLPQGTYHIVLSDKLGNAISSKALIIVQ